MTLADVERVLRERDIRLRVWFASGRFVAAIYDYGDCEISRATAASFADAVMLAVGGLDAVVTVSQRARVLH